jgi:hypothetical protein
MGFPLPEKIAGYKTPAKLYRIRASAISSTD